MANYNWPAVSVTTSSAPIEFLLDGNPTTVSQDTVVPGNSTPLPVTVLDPSGVPVVVAYDFGASSSAQRVAALLGNATGAALFGAGTTSAQVLRVVLPTDQSAIPVTGPLTDTQLRASAVPVSAASLPLPTGASTLAAQTDGSQKSQIVDGSGNVWGPRTNVGSVNYFPIINFEAATTGSAVPLRTLLIGGSDGTNIRTLSTDATGVLNTNIIGTVPVSGTVAVTQSTSPWVDNISQFGGSAVVTGTGASGAGIPRVTVSNDSNILASQSGTWNITNISGTISLPTGASTSALQTTGNTSLSSIDTKTLTAGQKVMAASYPVVIASDQSAIATTSTIAPNATGNSPGSSTVSTVATLTAPANTVGFIFMNLDTSTANIRYRIGGTATSSSGQQMQPGRDTGFIPCAANISICAESGTQNYDIQWILK